MRVIKDCWVEDHPGNQMEHEIVAGIKKDMGDEQKFREHFIDIKGYRKTDASGGFLNICKILETRTFIPTKYEPQFLIPAPRSQKSTYTGQTEGLIADRDHRLQSTQETEAPTKPPHPRFRYQIVYREKGMSLFELTSFAEVFVYICQGAEGS